jgi:hypothetical protein
MMMTRAWSYCVALALISAGLVGSAQDSRDASELVRQLAQFQAALDARIQSNTGLPMPAEQQRADTNLRTLSDQAVPALQRGLTDPDVQIRRNVALYLAVEGANYVKPAPLNLKPFMAQLVVALRDSDERVKVLAAQALEHMGADAVIAIRTSSDCSRIPARGCATAPALLWRESVLPRATPCRLFDGRCLIRATMSGGSLSARLRGSRPNRLEPTIGTIR